MTHKELETIIRDPSKSDEEVYPIWTRFYQELVPPPGQPDAADPLWVKRVMEDFEISGALEECRPKLAERNIIDLMRALEEDPGFGAISSECTKA